MIADKARNSVGEAAALRGEQDEEDEEKDDEDEKEEDEEGEDCESGTEDNDCDSEGGERRWR